MPVVLRLTPAGVQLLDEMGDEARYLEKPAARILVALDSNPEGLSRETFLSGDSSGEYKDAINFLRKEGYIWVDATEARAE